MGEAIWLYAVAGSLYKSVLEITSLLAIVSLIYYSRSH
jgi:hypothetical protein